MQSVRNSDLQTVYYGILIHKYSSEIQPFKMCDVSYGDFRPTPVHPIHIINIEKRSFVLNSVRNSDAQNINNDIHI